MNTDNEMNNTKPEAPVAPASATGAPVATDVQLVNAPMPAAGDLAGTLRRMELLRGVLSHHRSYSEALTSRLNRYGSAIERGRQTDEFQASLRVMQGEAMALAWSVVALGYWSIDTLRLFEKEALNLDRMYTQ